MIIDPEFKALIPPLSPDEYVLKPGGFLVSYVGHIHLDRILAQMTPYLDYYWIACLKHAGTCKAVHSRSATEGDIFMQTG